MEKMGEEAAAKFINALIKSVQTLCHGYLDFQTGIEIIGHINLSVDKENSLDYILKEKVCKNAENSTLFISHSFHAEPKSEQEVPVKNAQAGNQNVQSRQPTDSGESGRVSSALSSISSALSGSRERSRQSNTKDSGSPHSYQSTAKRKASDDSGSEVRPSKVSSHHDSISHTSSDSAFPPTSSSPVDSKQSLRHLRTSDDNMSQTMLPQTANFTSDNAADIGVNLAGSVLEPVDDQSNPDLPERDDESDGDLEVTFIKEEYMEGERSACEFENSGQQFVGGPHRRASEGMPDPSLYPVALHGSSASATYVPSAHDQQFQPGSLGPSTSQPQPGPSGMRDQGQADGTLHPPLPRWPHPHLERLFSAGLPSAALSAGGPSQLELVQHLIHRQQFPLPPLAQAMGMSGPSTSAALLPGRKLPTKRFQRGALLAQSSRDETGTLSFKCRMCEAKFKTSSGLAYHERQNHTDLPQYRCSICGKGFVSRGHYVGHMNMHNNTKTFVCTVCYKTFAYMSSLKFHMKMHTSTEVFECPVCAKKFSYEKSFKSHLNTHNRANAFNCPHCPKKFAYRSSLQYHLKTGCRGPLE
ncbi:uncharacterized protein [Littorina saxatilis]|uniref:uncharacterized protein isoform X4 n=1 Tax=Littorina saxatilis TaxID=31220 RepID=UPI0038B4986B